MPPSRPPPPALSPPPPTPPPVSYPYNRGVGDLDLLDLVREEVVRLARNDPRQRRGAVLWPIDRSAPVRPELVAGGAGLAVGLQGVLVDQSEG